MSSLTIPLVASLSEPIVKAATDFIDSVGALGVFVLMTLESACLPIPSEAIMLFAGFNVSMGKMTILSICVAGVAGNVVGSWIAYAIGYYGRRELLDKHRVLGLNTKHLDWVDGWFERRGDLTVLVARVLPVARGFISLPAGAARMPFWRFTFLTTVGCIPWVVMLALVGRNVGSNWEAWRHHLEYLDYAVAAVIVGGLIYLFVRRTQLRLSNPT